MKKLIKLLNEWLKYEEKFGPDKLTRVAGIDDSGELLFKLENGCYWSVEYVISKRCEFIKRLVDNDKIDLKKAKEGEIMLSRSDEENIIGKLSIQDKPIDFLISVLR